MQAVWTFFANKRETDRTRAGQTDRTRVGQIDRIRVGQTERRPSRMDGGLGL